MALSVSGWSTEDRSEPRDAVHHRTRALHPDGRLLPLIIVNTSAGGLMARCDAPCDPGDRLRIHLPQVGSIVAEIRWTLGGRIGCQLERAMAPAEYFTLLTALRP